MFKACLTLFFSIICTAVAVGGTEKWYSIEEELNESGAGWQFDFGSEFPGANGSFSVARNAATGDEYAIDLYSDFRKGGSYVAVGKAFLSPIKVQELQFQIKTAAKKIGLRIMDNSGQAHQQYLNLSGKPDDWQKITVNKLGGPSAEGFIHWGGTNDGVVKQPIKTLMFIVSNGDTAKPQWHSTIRRISWLTNQPPKVCLNTKPLTFWPSPGKDKILTLAVTTIPDDRQISFIYADYHGVKISEGKLMVTAGQQSIRVPLPPGKGYYELNIPELELTAGVMELAPQRGEPDPFFAIMSGFSCFSNFNDNDVVDSYLKVLRLSGIGWTRDFIPWTRLEREQGKPTWQKILYCNGENIRRLSAANRINIMDYFQEAPPWSGSVDSATEKYPYPRNLPATAVSWTKIMQHWNHDSALEVWNEPDIGLGAGLPGDHLSAVQKTLSYAFKKNNIPLELVGGVFTGTCIDPGFINIYLDNGLLDSSDVFSFHNYNVPDRLPSLVAKFRFLFRNSPKQEIPLWMTECGKPWPSGTPRAKLKDDQNSAFGIVMKAVEAKACGVAKYFAFIYCYYDEGLNNFGMIDKNHTPMRSMAAYAYCAQALSHKQYVGDLKGVKCYYAKVFSDGKDAVIVLAALTPKATVTLPKNLQFSRVEGADGRTLSAPDHTLQLNNEPVYVYCRHDAVKPLLNTNTISMKLLRPAMAYQAPPRQALPVVFQSDINLHEYPYTIYGYLIDSPEQTHLAVKINNLSDQLLTVKPAVSVTPDARITGLPETPIEIPPQSFVRLAFKADIRNALKQQKVVKVKVFDRNANASPLVFALQDGKKEKVIATAFNQTNQNFEITKLPATGWTEIKAWRNWGPGQTPSTIKAQFRTCWTPGKLQLQILVDDAEYCQPYPIYDAWQGDSIQVAFYRIQPSVEQLKTTEITAAKTAQGPEIFCHESVSNKQGLLKASKLRLYSRNNRYLYVIDLDAAETDLGNLTPDARIALSLLVNSNRGVGRDGYLYWGDGIGLSKNPKELNRVELNK